METTGALMLPSDALGRLLHSDAMRDVMDPQGPTDGAPDWSMRRAEAFETIEIVVAHAGTRFDSHELAGQQMFGYAQGGGFGIRESLRLEVLGMLHATAAHADMQTLDQLLSLVPRDLYDRSGEVLYSGADAFTRPSPIYVLGFNPGWNPDDPTLPTIRRDIDAALARIGSKSNWSAFRDDSWLGAKPGADPMQKRVLHLFEQLGLDPGLVPASNVVFARTRTAAELHAPERDHLAEECWPLHEAVIDRLGVRVVLCLGQDAGTFVQRKLNAYREWDTLREDNNRRWISRGYSAPSGVNVVVATHPSRADWTAPAADVTPLVKKALDR